MTVKFKGKLEYSRTTTVQTSVDAESSSVIIDTSTHTYKLTRHSAISFGASQLKINRKRKQTFLVEMATYK